MGLVHFTFTLSKPSTVYVAKLYINGVLDNTTTSSVTNYSLSTLNLFTVGGPNFDFVNGNIAVLKVYNRALSDAEVKQNYNASKKRYGL
jgi:hypothetical protein